MCEMFIAVLVALLEDRNDQIVRRIDKERDLRKDCEETYLNGYHDALIMVLSLLK